MKKVVEELLRRPGKLTTLQEFSTAAGLSPSQFVDCIEPLLESRCIELETVPASNDFFVRTAPNGRPLLDFQYLGVTIWEMLRVSNNPASAYALLRTLQAITSTGMDCTPAAAVDCSALTVYRPELFALKASTWVPVVANFTPEQCSSPTGVLADIARGGYPSAVVLADLRETVQYVAAIRTWHRRGGSIPVVICEVEGSAVSIIEVVSYGIFGKNT